jgi:hypothetical protein
MTDSESGLATQAPQQPTSSDIAAGLDMSALEALIQQRVTEGVELALRKQQGLPADPVEHAWNNLKEHFSVKRSCSPHHDWTVINEFMKSLPEDLESFTKDHADLVRVAFTDLVEHSTQIENINYLKQLANDFYKEFVLKTVSTAVTV